MKENPRKFHFALFAKENNSTPTMLLRVTLESLKVVKLLGQIDFELKFDEHISALCNTASRQKSVLARLSKTFNLNGKLKIIQPCMLCYFNYCPLEWHYCSQEDILKMEKIQYRALKYVYNDINLVMWIFWKEQICYSCFLMCKGKGFY